MAAAGSSSAHSVARNLPWWVTIVVLVRELGVTGLRFWVIRRGVMAASRGGKVKTADFAHPYVKGSGVQGWLDSLPHILAGDSFRAVVEAMAHGLPVVAFDSGSIREICGEDAVYASTGNAHSLAEGIAQIIESPRDSWIRGKRLQARALREFDANMQGGKMLEAIL